VTRFVHDTRAQRVRFASGWAAEQLAAEAVELKASRMMVIAGESERDLARRVAGALPVAVWHHDVAMHVPVEVAARARAAAAARTVDLLVSVGGGSTTGLAKAVALTTGLPIIALPTDVRRVGGDRRVGSDRVRSQDDRNRSPGPAADGRLRRLADAHAAGGDVGGVRSQRRGALHRLDVAPRADSINTALAGEGLRALNAGLRAVKADPAGLPGREQTLQGAYLSGVAFASAGSGLHHKICHVLGGMFDLPHAQTHAVVLPHVLALNGSAAPEAERRIALALDAPTAVEGLAALRAELDAPTALRDHGMPADGIAPAVEAVLAAVPAGNPATVTCDQPCSATRCRASCRSGAWACSAVTTSSR
jgi:maleylacetate reductase